MPTLQGSLFVAGEMALAPLDEAVRHWLDRWSWVDVLPSWVRGADALYADLAAALPWNESQRPMYDRMVAVPRLTTEVDLADESVPPIVGEMARELQNRYDEPLDAVFANHYRDGADSVAWHGDRVGRTRTNPTVAVVSLGGERRFLLRPSGGGRSIRHVLRSGDLLVMGGACQHRWEHGVPKTARAEPRISVTFRHREQRPP